MYNINDRENRYLLNNILCEEYYYKYYVFIKTKTGDVANNI